MRSKKTQARSKAGEKVALASNNIKLRRCEIKLRRYKVNGVGSNQTNSSKSLLLEQQTQKKSLDVEIAQPKMLKTLPENSSNTTKTRLQQLKKCEVKLKRISLKSDGNQNVIHPNMEAPTTRNSFLALTKRRAMELGLKNNTETTKRPTNINDSSVQLTSNVSKKLDSTTEMASSSRKLANKPNAITELLLTEEEKSSTTDKVIPTQESTGSETKMTHKFFHKEHKNTTQISTLKILKNTKTKNQKPKNTNKKTKTKRIVSSQVTSESNNDIYEFLSQSQTSDSDGIKNNDVASDIIKKLIDDGKAVFSKYHKGKSRRKPQPSKNRKNKLKTIDKKQIKPKLGEVKNTITQMDKDDHFEQVAELPLPSAVEESLTYNGKKSSRNFEASGADSTFSRLARSVLMRKANNLANLTKQNVADGKTALKILQRYNSTPFKPQQKSLQLPVAAELSPIQSRLNEKSNASYREIDLFDISARELSSFSNSANETIATTANLNRSKHQKTQLTASTSSFSSNDSNAENQPPPLLTTPLQTQENNRLRTDENDVIHSARQIPNPRRILKHRSPLKAINIIDIVTLPNYKEPITNKSKSNENSRIEKLTEKSELFGFEEYLDENDEAKNETENNSLQNEKANNKSSKLNISKQLRKLKRLHPKTPIYSRNPVNSTITKNIFGNDDDNAGKVKGNRNIKEMFCSTMINNERTEDQMTASSSKILDSDNEDSNDSAFANKMLEKKTAELFGDPETTFDQKSLRRTYERPFKRKRKLIHQFSDIFESGDENSDDDVDDLNSSVTEEKRPKAKRRQAENPVNEELDKFVSEFNSMLKEAEDYELVVE